MNKPRLQLEVESLEQRILLAASLTVSGDTLIYQGGDADDTVYVEYWGGRYVGDGPTYLRVLGYEDNQPTTNQRFYIRDVRFKKIEFYGGKGDDRFYNKSNNVGHEQVPVLQSLAYGDEGYDILQGNEKNDRLYTGTDGGRLIGLGGNDKLYGGPGSDTIEGGDDNDTIHGNHGNDTLRGGDGEDVIFGSDGNDYIHGGKKNDKLYGGNGNDRIDADEGNDRVRGGAGNDGIRGGIGNDVLYGEGDDDFILGGSGSDKILGGNGNDFLNGAGANSLDSNDLPTKRTEGENLVVGGRGNDQLIGGFHNDRLIGKQGDDYLQGDEGNDFLSGGGDDDTYAFKGRALGNDEIATDSGYDTLDLVGFESAFVLDLNRVGQQALSSQLSLKLNSIDAIEKVDGNNRRTAIIHANNNNNEIRISGNNQSSVYLKRGGDILHLGNKTSLFFLTNAEGNKQIRGTNLFVDFRALKGGHGLDLIASGTHRSFVVGTRLDGSIIGTTSTIRGTKYDDVIHGASNSETIYGEDGDDTLYGDGGNDTLYGGPGNDGLFGGEGTDTLHGKGGADRFLVQEGDKLKDLQSKDARIRFLRGDTEWKDSEVQEIDYGLTILHHATGNTRLLKTSSKRELRFKLYVGNVDGAIAYNRLNGTIEFGTNVFRGFSTYEPHHVVTHEIGHNWEFELADDMVRLSNWISRDPDKALEDQAGYRANVDWKLSGDRKYYYDGDASFAPDLQGNTNYARTNLSEDIAQSFFLHFYRDDIQYGNTVPPFPTQKVNAVKRLINSLN